MTGSTSTVGRTESPTQVVLTASFPVSDADGNELGDAAVTATMTPVGDPEIIGPTPARATTTRGRTGRASGSRARPA